MAVFHEDRVNNYRGVIGVVVDVDDTADGEEIDELGFFSLDIESDDFGLSKRFRAFSIHSNHLQGYN